MPQESTAPQSGATVIHRRVAALRDGRDPALIARMNSGWAVLGDPQVLAGYCLLLPDPVVAHLNELPALARAQFLADMSTLGDALLAVTGAIRINYAMLGNQEPALHAHVFPRYSDEPMPQRSFHPWSYDWSRAPAFDVGRHAELIGRIRARLPEV